ncbi:MAG: Gfo/Idh/MocA family protein [Bacillota bacterium]
MSKDKVRAAIIGMGIGRPNGMAIDNNPRGEVVALCDLVEERMEDFQEQLGKEVKFYTDYRKLCQDPEIDAVFVGTPNQNHVPIAIEVAKSGKHLLVTKPLADSAEKAEELVKVVKEEGMVNMMSLSMRNSPACVYLQRQINEGKFGEVYYAKASSIRRNGIPLGYCDLHPEETDPDIGFLQKGGGAMRDMGVHVLDASWFLMGMPKPISALGVSGAKFGPRGEMYWSDTEKDLKDRFNTDDFGGGFIRFEGGFGIQVESFWASHHPEKLQVELFGTEAGATLKPLKIFKNEDGGFQEIDVDPLNELGSWDKIAENFISCILDGAENKAPLEYGLTVQKMLEAVLESSKKGEEVKIK